MFFYFISFIFFISVLSYFLLKNPSFLELIYSFLTLFAVRLFFLSPNFSNHFLLHFLLSREKVTEEKVVARASVYNFSFTNFFPTKQKTWPKLQDVMYKQVSLVWTYHDLQFWSSFLFSRKKVVKRKIVDRGTSNNFFFGHFFPTQQKTW